MKIEIGSLVKLDKSKIALDEWVIRDYGNLMGLVTDIDEDEVEVLWQGNGFFYDGERSQDPWHYVIALELVQ